MAQGQFTKQEADNCIEALDEIMKSMPRGQLGKSLGHLNDLFLFLKAAKEHAPDKKINTEPSTK